MTSSLKNSRGLLFAILAWMTVAAWASACDTPVYRYAMYRWPASKYYVFFVHSAEADAEQAKVNEAIQQIEAAEDPKPNVVFFDIKAEEIETAPPIAAEHWKKIGKPESAYIVVAPPPLGGVVYAGDLKLNDVRSMVASPLRTEIANRLEEGAATVFLLLEADEKKAAKDAKDSKAKEGEDAEPQQPMTTNKSAAAIAKHVVQSVNDGQITLYATPKPGEIGGAGQPLKPEHKIATVTLSRDNPDEQWLIRMLLAVESDLHEFNQPMVFPIYGRGRVHPPFLGLGVTEDNLIEAVQFVTGACSCTVKEQNPGVDLLFDYDWESAAIAMAEKFGAEEGNEQLGAVDLFPELIIPGASGEVTEDVSAENGSSDVEAAETAAAKASSDNTDGSKASEEPAVEDPSALDPSEEAAHGESNEVALAPAESETSKVTPTYAMASVWAVVGVLLAAVAGLFVATLFILRPR